MSSFGYRFQVIYMTVLSSAKEYQALIPPGAFQASKMLENCIALTAGFSSHVSALKPQHGPLLSNNSSTLGLRDQYLSTFPANATIMDMIRSLNSVSYSHAVCP
jgi:hypothetical protein